jgi:hypothetical protein
LTDLLGRTVIEEEEVQAAHKIDMTAVKSGIYFLKIKNAHGIQSIKVIKN